MYKVRTWRMAARSIARLPSFSVHDHIPSASAPRVIPTVSRHAMMGGATLYQLAMRPTRRRRDGLPYVTAVQCSPWHCAAVLGATRPSCRWAGSTHKPISQLSRCCVFQTINHRLPSFSSWRHQDVECTAWIFFSIIQRLIPAPTESSPLTCHLTP